MDKHEKNMKKWIKSNATTLTILCSAIASVWIIKSDSRAMERRLTALIHEIDLRLTKQINDGDVHLSNDMRDLDKRLAAIETILIMQGASLRAFARDKDIP